jgi:hypothetical protein
MYFLLKLNSSDGLHISSKNTLANFQVGELVMLLMLAFRSKGLLT